MKEPSKITHDMSEHERAKYLKKKIVKLVFNDNKVINLDDNRYNHYKVLNKTEIKKVLRTEGEKLQIFKVYYDIGDTSLNALFSKNNLFESVSKSNDNTLMFYAIYNIDNLLKESIKIEEHLDNKGDENNKQTHELLSILKVKKSEYILFKITVKESKYQNNNIYSLSNFQTIKKKDGGHPQMFDSQALETGHPLSTINLSQLIIEINSPDILRYIPNELLSNRQIEIKQIALEKYDKKKEWQKNKKE